MCVSVQVKPSTSLGVQLIPEVHVSKNRDRAEVLEIIKRHLACGTIESNGRKGDVLVLAVRRHKDLLEKVIPFFERSPLLSANQKEFEVFASVVKRMAAGEHLNRDGLSSILALALTTNGGGRYRKRTCRSQLHRLESQETTRQHTR